MIRSLLSRVVRFKRDENGNATIEFVMLFPAMMVIMLSGIELAFVTLQHAMLERAMDMTVREIRLGTGAILEHDDIKDSICDRAGFIKDCETNLRLEMVQVDPRVAVTIAADPDCTDTSEDVNPVRSFVNGQSNELMILRACAKIEPVFPTSGMGKSLADNADAQYALVAMAVFVQEPQ